MKVFLMINEQTMNKRKGGCDSAPVLVLLRIFTARLLLPFLHPLHVLLQSGTRLCEALYAAALRYSIRLQMRDP